MISLEKRFIETSSRPIVNKGNNIPTWAVGDNWEDRSKWYNDEGVNFLYNVVNSPENTDTVYIQYGVNRTGWASVVFMKYIIKTETIEPIDNSRYRVKGSIEVPFYKGKKTTTASAGFNMDVIIKVNNSTFFNFNANTFSDFNKTSNQVIDFNVIVEPETYSNELLLDINITYEAISGFPDNIFKIGMTYYNPNPPTYVPMAIRKNGNWKDLNTNKGKILIRKGSNWIDKSEENINTSREIDKGKNRIRKNGYWRQLPPMESDRPI